MNHNLIPGLRWFVNEEVWSYKYFGLFIRRNYTVNPNKSHWTDSWREITAVLKSNYSPPRRSSKKLDAITSRPPKISLQYRSNHKVEPLKLETLLILFLIPILPTSTKLPLPLSRSKSKERLARTFFSKLANNSNNNISLQLPQICPLPKKGATTPKSPKAEPPPPPTKTSLSPPKKSPSTPPPSKKAVPGTPKLIAIRADSASNPAASNEFPAMSAVLPV